MRTHFRGIKFLYLSAIGKIPSQRIRRGLYCAAGMHFGSDSVIFMGAEIRSPDKIKLGSGASIGHHCVLDGRNGITIGDNVNFSHGVWVWTAQHDVNDPDFKVVGGPVNIGSYAWLGGRVIVLPGITIGEGAVVASGAVVTKDVPPWTIVAGIPAKKIGMRPSNMQYKLKAMTAMI